MLRATAKDLRFHPKRLMDSVARGEEIVITFRGKPLARLVAYQDEMSGRKVKNELFGIWKDDDRTRDVNKYVRGLRKGREG